MINLAELYSTSRNAFSWCSTIWLRGKGYIFGGFRPTTGDVYTKPYERRTAANRTDFLAHGYAWLPTDGNPVYAIIDNLSAHRATDVLLLSVAHPRWEFIFQPKYAAYLNLIEL